MASVAALMLNRACSPCMISLVCADCSALQPMFVIPNTASAMPKAGREVISRYLMCLNRSTPQHDEASTVVSLNGDSLSPK